MTEDWTAPAASAPRRSVARNAAALLLSQSFTWVLATIVVSLQPRFLGPHEQGQVRLGASLGLVITTLAAFGSSTFMTVEIARDQGLARRLVGNVMRLRIVVMAALVPPLALFVWVAGYDRPTVIIIALSVLAAALALAPNAQMAAMYGLQEMGATSRVDVQTKLFVTVGTVAVLLAGGRAYALAGLSVVSTVLMVGLMARAFRRVVPRAQHDTAMSGRGLLLLSLPFLLADASLVIYQQVDTVVISLLVDEETIGWYGTADVLFGSVLFVPTILMTALFPAIAERHSRAPEEVAGMLERTLRSTLLVAVPIGVATIVVSRSFVSAVYGASYAETAPVLQVLGVVTILSCVTILLGRFAIATGYVRFWSVLMISAIVMSIPLDLVLVPWTERRFDNGAIGGALAYVVTETFMVIVGMARLARHLVNWRVAIRVLKCTIAGAAMLAVGLALHDTTFVLSGSVAAMAYLVVLLVLRTPDETERAQLRQLTGRFRGRGGVAA